MSETDWDRLQLEAAEIIEQTIAELPLEVQAEAKVVPCLFERENEDDPDLLGLYRDFTPGAVSDSNGPIILYLLAIQDLCHVEETDFRDEVRLTYLHELGHQLGWDEDDLQARGLE